MRFLRPDAHRFVRPDVARYLQPGVDPADVFPALAQQRDRQRQAEVRQLKAEIAELAAMRDDLLAMKAEIARRCEATIAARKYSPNQPRVPRGNSDGGQWTSQSRGGGGGLFDGFVSGDSVGGDSSGSGALGFADPSSPMGNIDFGDLTGWSESDGLFNIAPDEGDSGDRPQVASSERPSLGRAGIIGILLELSARAIQAYRSENNLFDLFGRQDGTAAYTKIDDKEIFGVNSTSPSYSSADRHDAEIIRDALVARYPDVMINASAGYMPSNAIFHAETNVLLRASRENGGSLAGLSLNVVVDNRMCNNCDRVLPLVGLELGNPSVTVIDTRKVPRTFRNGAWLDER